MEAKTPQSILVAYTNCADPSKEAEFKQWYEKVHLPDVVGTGAFYAATLYVNVNPQPGDHKFIAIYLSDKGLEETQKIFRAGAAAGQWRERGRLSPLLADAKTMFFEKQGAYTPAASTAQKV
jgi:hypothetical protein